MNKWFTNISLSLISTGLLFIILEVFLRIFFPVNNVIRLATDIFQDDNLLGYIHKPNIFARDISDEWDIIIKTNSDGLRENRDYDKVKQKNIIRLLGLGDSFTYGHGVDLKDTYLKILENLLNNGIFNNNTKFEVINCAFPGWGIAQEFLFFKERGHKYESSLVIIGLIDDDIFRNDNYYNMIISSDSIRQPQKIIIKPKIKLIIRIKDCLFFNTRTYPFIASKVSQIDWINNFLYFVGLREKSNQYFRTKDYLVQSIHRAKNIFLRFKVLCKEKDTDLLVVLIPSDDKESILTDSKTNEINDQIVDLLLEMDINVLDLRTSFSASNKQLYFLLDRHPNPDGHYLIGSELYKYLNNFKFRKKFAIR